MKTHDIHRSTQPAVSLLPQTPAATGLVNGSAVDTLGYNGGIALVQVGTSAGASVTFTIQTAVDVAGAPGAWVDAKDINNAPCAAVVTPGNVAKIRYDPDTSERWVRITANVTAGANVPIGGLVLRANAKYAYPPQV
jgi:hypothetical protein